MFKQLKNIDTAFKHTQRFSLVFLVAVTIICCFTVFKSYEYAREVEQRLYVMRNGNVEVAVAGSRAENLVVEARNHVENFHRLFFTLTPDQQAIDGNIRKALYLADQSAKRQYDNLREAGYYSQIITANASQELISDSIIVSTKSAFHFRFYGKQRIVRQTAIVIRRLVTEGDLRELQQRTDPNPHALLIERWAIIENEDIEVLKR